MRSDVPARVAEKLEAEAIATPPWMWSHERRPLVPSSPFRISRIEILGVAAIIANTRQEFILDFSAGAVGHRLRFGGGRGQALPKAAGFTGGNTPSVVDATAGLGRDAFLLASLGARVTLLERSPEVHALLRNGLARARAAGPRVSAIVARMTLLHGDAKDLLHGLQADVVIVDPMHPLRKKTALVKKEMRLLRQLVGSDADALELMQAALASARKRVVLKWPLHASDLAGLSKPSHQIIGRTVRYDVFML
jgi:16S rRNA (guanine1516-N2)-methyltransferase